MRALSLSVLMMVVTIALSGSSRTYLRGSRKPTQDMPHLAKPNTTHVHWAFDRFSESQQKNLKIPNAIKNVLEKRPRKEFILRVKLHMTPTPENKYNKIAHINILQAEGIRQLVAELLSVSDRLVSVIAMSKEFDMEDDVRRTVTTSCREGSWRNSSFPFMHISIHLPEYSPYLSRIANVLNNGTTFDDAFKEGARQFGVWDSCVSVCRLVASPTLYKVFDAGLTSDCADAPALWSNIRHRNDCKYAASANNLWWSEETDYGTAPKRCVKKNSTHVVLSATALHAEILCKEGRDIEDDFNSTFCEDRQLMTSEFSCLVARCKWEGEWNNGFCTSPNLITPWRCKGEDEIKFSTDTCAKTCQLLNECVAYADSLGCRLYRKSSTKHDKGSQLSKCQRLREPEVETKLLIRLQNDSTNCTPSNEDTLPELVTLPADLKFCHRQVESTTVTRRYECILFFYADGQHWTSVGNAIQQSDFQGTIKQWLKNDGMRVDETEILFDEMTLRRRLDYDASFHPIDDGQRITGKVEAAQGDEKKSAAASGPETLDYAGPCELGFVMMVHSVKDVDEKTQTTWHNTMSLHVAWMPECLECARTCLGEDECVWYRCNRQGDCKHEGMYAYRSHDSLKISTWLHDSNPMISCIRAKQYARVDTEKYCPAPVYLFRPSRQENGSIFLSDKPTLSQCAVLIQREPKCHNTTSPKTSIVTPISQDSCHKMENCHDHCRDEDTLFPFMCSNCTCRNPVCEGASGNVSTVRCMHDAGGYVPGKPRDERRCVFPFTNSNTRAWYYECVEGYGLEKPWCNSEAKPYGLSFSIQGDASPLIYCDVPHAIVQCDAEMLGEHCSACEDSFGKLCAVTKEQDTGFCFYLGQTAMCSPLGEWSDWIPATCNNTVQQTRTCEPVQRSSVKHICSVDFDILALNSSVRGAANTFAMNRTRRCRTHRDGDEEPSTKLSDCCCSTAGQKMWHDDKVYEQEQLVWSEFHPMINAIYDPELNMQPLGAVVRRNLGSMDSIQDCRLLCEEERENGCNAVIWYYDVGCLKLRNFMHCSLPVRNNCPLERCSYVTFTVAYIASLTSCKGGGIHCNLHFVDTIEKVWYHGRDITAKLATTSSHNYTVEFEYVPHAALTVVGNGSSQNGLSIVCSANHYQSPFFNFVGDSWTIVATGNNDSSLGYLTKQPLPDVFQYTAATPVKQPTRPPTFVFEGSDAVWHGNSKYVAFHICEVSVLGGPCGKRNERDTYRLCPPDMACVARREGEEVWQVGGVCGLKDQYCPWLHEDVSRRISPADKVADGHAMDNIRTCWDLHSGNDIECAKVGVKLCSESLPFILRRDKVKLRPCVAHVAEKFRDFGCSRCSHCSESEEDLHCHVKQHKSYSSRCVAYCEGWTKEGTTLISGLCEEKPDWGSWSNWTCNVCAPAASRLQLRWRNRSVSYIKKFGVTRSYTRVHVETQHSDVCDNRASCAHQCGCRHGTPSELSCVRPSIQRCSRCEDGYFLSSKEDASGKEKREGVACELTGLIEKVQRNGHIEPCYCVRRQCECSHPNRTATGAQCERHGLKKCASCPRGLHLMANGTAGDEWNLTQVICGCAPGLTLQFDKCAGVCASSNAHYKNHDCICNQGYHLNDTSLMCDQNRCTCDQEARAAIGIDCNAHGTHKCICDEGYVDDGAGCSLQRYHCKCDNGDISNSSRCSTNTTLETIDACADGSCKEGYVMTDSRTLPGEQVCIPKSVTRPEPVRVHSTVRSECLDVHSCRCQWKCALCAPKSSCHARISVPLNIKACDKQTEGLLNSSYLTEPWSTSLDSTVSKTCAHVAPHIANCTSWTLGKAILSAGEISLFVHIKMQFPWKHRSFPFEREDEFINVFIQKLGKEQPVCETDADKSMKLLMIVLFLSIAIGVVVVGTLLVIRLYLKSESYQNFVDAVPHFTVEDDPVADVGVVKFGHCSSDPAPNRAKGPSFSSNQLLPDMRALDASLESPTKSGAAGSFDTGSTTSGLGPRPKFGRATSYPTASQTGAICNRCIVTDTGRNCKHGVARPTSSTRLGLCPRIRGFQSQRNIDFANALLGRDVHGYGRQRTPRPARASSAGARRPTDNVAFEHRADVARKQRTALLRLFRYADNLNSKNESLQAQLSQKVAQRCEFRARLQNLNDKAEKITAENGHTRKNIEENQLLRLRLLKAQLLPAKQPRMPSARSQSRTSSRGMSILNYFNPRVMTPARSQMSSAPCLWAWPKDVPIFDRLLCRLDHSSLVMLVSRQQVLLQRIVTRLLRMREYHKRLLDHVIQISVSLGRYSDKCENVGEEIDALLAFPHSAPNDAIRMKVAELKSLRDARGAGLQHRTVYRRPRAEALPTITVKSKKPMCRRKSLGMAKPSAIAWGNHGVGEECTESKSWFSLSWR